MERGKGDRARRNKDTVQHAAQLHQRCSREPVGTAPGAEGGASDPGAQWARRLSSLRAAVSMPDQPVGHTQQGCECGREEGAPQGEADAAVRTEVPKRFGRILEP